MILTQAFTRLHRNSPRSQWKPTGRSSAVDATEQGITTGFYGAGLRAVRSCADLLTPTTGTFTIEWNNGRHGFSMISFSRTATIIGGTIVVTETGIVVAGDFASRSTLFVTTGPHNPLECLNDPGVTDVDTTA
jgi:hypothetical protein